MSAYLKLLSSLRRKNNGDDDRCSTTSFTSESLMSMRDSGSCKTKKCKSISLCDLKFTNADCLDAQKQVLQVAARGDIKEFVRLYNADNSRLHIKDSKGQSCLHAAAANAKVVIMDFILAHGGDINITDDSGNTPLHISVEKKQKESIDYLICNHADTSIRNVKQLAPLHVAVVNKQADIMECLLKHDGVDVNITAEQGCTSLHICASIDADECAQKLLEYGGKPCQPCHNGFYPLHIAALNACAKTLEVFIKITQKMGYTRETVMSFMDKENNMPLHSAVQGGDIKAVRVCLDAGAPIDAQQTDKSTSVHFACSQGSLEMIQLMNEKQPERFQKALFTFDVLKMTPLHRAALFNHISVVKYLITEGAEIDARDELDRTPLLLAGSKGAWHTVHHLLHNGANINVKDRNNRNFLHLAIQSGGRLQQFEIIKTIKDLLDDKDDFGCTPLHYASREGYLTAIDDLINLGATINPKNNDRQSPFHFAARYGRYNTCKRLLESRNGHNIINETDGEGLTALHIAAQNGHTKVLGLLMQKGAVIHRENKGNSPLHYAASNGYTQSMRVLLNVHSNLMDLSNKDGNTALHIASQEGHVSAVTVLLTLGAKMDENRQQETFSDLAIENKHTDVALAVVKHARWEEWLNCCSPKYGCPMVGLIKELPEVCMAVLDRCQTYSSGARQDSKYYVDYNFKYLQCPLHWVKENKKADDVTPMLSLNSMVQHGRVDCLSHPVCVNYLRMKWSTYGMWFYLVNMFIYVVYLVLLTQFISSFNGMHHYDSEPIDNATRTILNGNSPGGYQLSVMNTISLYGVVIFCVSNVIKEIIQMFQQKRKYFTDGNNILEWILYMSSLVFLAPFLVGWSYHFQWQAGAIAVLLAWFNFLLFLQRFDFFGIYVVMFIEIFRTLVQVLCVFSVLIIAFGLSFYILLSAEESRAHATPGLSILRTGMMMIELDYLDLFNGPYTDGLASTLHFDKLTLCLLVLFVLLMPILLMNLLIGLAVGDIESVKQDARLKRLAMQVEMHTDLERKLPLRFLLKVDKEKFRIYPNKCENIMSRIMSKVTLTSDDIQDSRSCTSRQNEYYQQELLKQKNRMKDISKKLDKQHDLLRLIVQKMEISTEDDYRDEGVSHDDNCSNLVPGQRQSLGWNTTKTEWQSGRNVVQEMSVLSRWKNAKMSKNN